MSDTELDSPRTARFFAAGAPVAVLTTAPIGKPLDYQAPAEGCVQGACVRVPLGARTVTGVVWGTAQSDWPQNKLKSITHVWDMPPLPLAWQRFIERFAAYTITPLETVLKLGLHASGSLRAPRTSIVYRLSLFAYTRLSGQQADAIAAFRALTIKQQSVIAALLSKQDTVLGGGTNPPMPDLPLLHYPNESLLLKDLTQRAGCSAALVRHLQRAGWLDAVPCPLPLLSKPLDTVAITAQEFTRPQSYALNAEQTQAAGVLCDPRYCGQYHTFVLKGITGSGKTEVYIEAITAALQRGHQVLVLLPEIALTGAVFKRIKDRFAAAVGVVEWHSGLRPRARQTTWHNVAHNTVRVVVGARSALFLPFANLGLIVVDEEHDQSYKQEEKVLYSARDMAVLRGSVGALHVVLSSATPSLETWMNVHSGKYTQVELTHRFGGACLPRMRAIDMRTESLPRNRWLSNQVSQAISERLERGEQALLFLNRRGYAPITLCGHCGYQIGCLQCDARMVQHRTRYEKVHLLCHQCGAERALPNTCPMCAASSDRSPSQKALRAVGPGIERLAEEIATQFPCARLSVLSSDLFASADMLHAEINHIANQERDIIIGTQLVAKGHHFPHLTLVAVIDCDLGLYGADLRAGERTFQLIRQVSGRAGRNFGQNGLVLLQTYQPQHPVLDAILADDTEGFCQAELAARRDAFMPPYSRLAAVIISSPIAKAAMQFANALGAHHPMLDCLQADVFGPVWAPFSKIRGQHRVRLLVRADKHRNLQSALLAWVAAIPCPRGVRCVIDIDPQSFL